MKINNLIKELKTSEGKLITYHNSKKVEYSFSELYPLILKSVAVLKKRGFDHNTVLGIVNNNDLSWIVADLSCLFCGIKLLPLELNSNIEQNLGEHLKLSGILVGDRFYKKLKEDKSFEAELINLNELFPEESDENLDSLQPYSFEGKEVLSYKTTSGSTGIPKVIGQSVECTENSIVGCQKMFQHSRDDKLMVFLPLNLLQQRYWLYSAIIYEFTVIIIPKEYVFISLKMEKPTVIMGVPYIYEFLYTEFKSKLKKDLNLQKEYDEFKASDKEEGKSFLPFLNYLGGEIRYLWTGSAPLSGEIIEFYNESNIHIYQGYGMNETCIISKNCPGNNKIGSVGKLFNNIEVKFDENSQILVRSKYPVCESYTVASEEDNVKTFIDDNYIATGDIGHIDEDGYLYITGRMKEMIILSNSKKVYPQTIEQKINLHSEIKYTVLYGDKKPYLTALIVPESNTVAKEDLDKIIKDYNENCNVSETIFKFILTNEDFTNENDLLSNQNKIRRQNIYKKYKHEYEKLYN